MGLEIFEVMNPGLGGTFQDRGRSGWRRFGVPPGGAMDDHAAGWANRLLENAAGAPVLELLLQGAKLAVLNDAWIAITGADAEASVPAWRATRVCAGHVIQFPHNRFGCWIYVAVEGGFDAPRFLFSASVYPRGNLGKPMAVGDILRRTAAKTFQLPPGVGGIRAPWTELRHYEAPPLLRVWPGPQWEFFDEPERSIFFAQEWTVTSKSDRVGYRLSGPILRPHSTGILSEPVRVGTIQIPENGQPIVTMRDGPTVGGYPKLGLVDPLDLSWLAQCRTGQQIRFQRADEV